MESKQSDALQRVMDLVRFLRAHCPWDAKQTPRSLIPYLLEEAHECADAITEGDDGALRSELGDLLLNLAFQIVLGEEREAFDAEEVADQIIEKMQRRHPHLFGLGEHEDWETLKARERNGALGTLSGVARGLEPLSRAHRIQDRVAAVGFDWEDASGAFEKVAEELAEVREAVSAPEPDAALVEEEIGDLLFAVVNVSRLTGAHPLTALQAANAKFSRRFSALETLAAERDIALGEAGLAVLDGLWDEVKEQEKATGARPGTDRSSRGDDSTAPSQ